MLRIKMEFLLNGHGKKRTSGGLLKRDFTSFKWSRIENSLQERFQLRWPITNEIIKPPTVGIWHCTAYERTGTAGAFFASVFKLDNLRLWNTFIPYVVDHGKDIFFVQDSLLTSWMPNAENCKENYLVKSDTNRNAVRLDFKSTQLLCFQW